MKTLILLLICISGVYGQNVQLNRLDEVVRGFVEERPDFHNLRASCFTLTNCPNVYIDGAYLEAQELHFHQKTYLLDVKAEEFADALKNSHPKDIWSGDSRFNLSYNQKTKKLGYRQDIGLKLSEGDLVLLNLTVKMFKFVKVQIPVAFEIILLDSERNEFVFSYARGNKSQGIQHIKLFERGAQTKVVHTTKYKSSSDFRDKNLYGHFHEKLTDDFYQSLESLIKSRRSALLKP